MLTNFLSGYLFDIRRFASLVATQNFPHQNPSEALNLSRKTSTVQEKFSSAANASETKQRFSMTKPSSGKLVKENVVLGNAKVPPSGVDIFTRSVILVKKETGRGKPEERKPAVVLNMSYNVPLEHCKESIASKVYGMWTEGLAVVGQSFEYENLLVEFLPKSDKEIQIPPHIRDTINPNDVHEITIRITKKREGRKHHPAPVQKVAVAVPAKVPALVESSEISLSGLKNFVSGAGVFDSSNLALSNASRLGTSCVLGPFGLAKSTVSAKTVFPPLATTDDGLHGVVAAAAALDSGSDTESGRPVSPETHSKGKPTVISTSHESHTVHWKSTVEEERSGESLAVEGTLSGSDEPLGLFSEVAQPVTVDEETAETVLPGGSIELKKLLLAGPVDLSSVDAAVISSQPITASEFEVISGRKTSQEEEDVPLNLVTTSGDPLLGSAPSSSGINAPSLAPTPSSNVDPVTSGDQLVIANTFKLNAKTFESLPSTINAPPLSSASAQPAFRLIGVSASKNSLVNSFRLAPSMVRPTLVVSSATPTGLIVSTSGSLPRSGLVNANKIHLAPSLSLPVAVSGSSGATPKSTSFLVVPKTIVSSFVKSSSTAGGSLLPGQQRAAGSCLIVGNTKVLKIGVPVCSASSTRGESMLQSVALPGKINSSFVQVKPVSTSASGLHRMMVVSTAETAPRPKPSASFVLKQGGGTDVRQLATRVAGQSPAKDVIEIKDDSDEVR